MPLIVASDSHYLSEIGSGRMVFEMLAPTFAEFARAITRTGTRGAFHA
jgi:hypothetical protein